MVRASDPRLLEALVRSERQGVETLKAWSTESATAAANLNAWAVADSASAEFQDMAMRISAILMSCADSQKHYHASLKAYVDALAVILTRDKDVKVILRDREILVSRVLKLTSKKPSERSTDAYNNKLDEAQRELGACEAVLKQEESDLALAKQRIFKEALEGRFKAMIDVGGLWQHTAEEALALLDRVGLDGDLLDSPELSLGNGHLHDTGSPAFSEQGEEDRRARVASDPGYGGNNIVAVVDAGRQNGSLGRTARPPTVAEAEEGSSDEDEAAVRQFQAHQNTNKKGGSVFGSPNKANHRRNDSESTNGMQGSPRKGGFFGSIASIFKPRDGIEMRQGGNENTEKDARYSSSKKGGWTTRTESNLTVTKALSEKAKSEAAARRVANAPRPRRGSDVSFTDNRPLIKVVNSNGPPLWQELGITAPASKTSTSTRKRAGSVVENIPTGNAYTNARRAMSDSGLDEIQTYNPPPVAKRRSPASPQLSRANSVTSNASIPNSILKKRETVWKPVPTGQADKYTPSLLSVVSDGGARNTAPKTSNRKYLTGQGAPGGSLGSLGVVPTTATKVKRPSTITPKPSVQAKPAGAMSLPVANAYRAPPEDVMTTLVLPSAAGSRAVVSGNTLTLPSAPPPVTAMPLARAPSPIPFPSTMGADSQSGARRVPNPDRAPSPTPTNATRRKSVRIADDVTVGEHFHEPVPRHAAQETPKGKARASEEQIKGWTPRASAESDEEEEDADVGEYKQARLAMQRRWDVPEA